MDPLTWGVYSGGDASDERSGTLVGALTSQVLSDVFTLKTPETVRACAALATRACGTPTTVFWSR